MKNTIVLLAGLTLANLAQAESALVVIVNPDAPVESIDPAQATQIFLKQVQTWPDGKRIQPVDIQEGSPLRAEFYSKVTGRSPGQLRAYWARQAFTGMGIPPRQVATAEDVSRLVGKTPGAIGYVDRKEADGQVRIVLDASK